MKFAEKYEILEMVTSGRVSTFLARERATQEPVVVYTFECVGSGAGELSTASIIARFCALAPNPPGMIVKAGFDGPSSSAFITTKMPEAEALQGWVRAYQSFGQAAPAQVVAGAPTPQQGGGPVSDATVELNAFEVKSALGQSRAGQVQPPKPTVGEIGEELAERTAMFSLGEASPGSEKSAGDFTRLFREVNAFEPVKKNPTVAPTKPAPANDAIFGERLSGSRLGGNPVGGNPFAPPSPPAQPAAPAPVENSPGSFTREFLGISNENAEPGPRQTQPPVPSKSEPGAFTREFMAVSPPAPKSSNTGGGFPPPRTTGAPPPATSFDSIFGSATLPSEAPGDMGGEAENPKGGAGEFTNFFRDPFEHPGAPSKSIPMPDVTTSTPAKKPAGDFTSMFGPGDLGRAPDPQPEPQSQPAPGSFTQIFRDISTEMGKGSQPGSSGLGTSPNARPSFLDPPPAPVQASADPFRGGMSSTPVAAPLDPFFSRTPTPAVPAANPFMNRAGSSEATNVFRAPGLDAPPVEAAPSGPSDFTMFISRSQLNAALPPEPGAAPPIAPPAPQPPPFQFAPPPMPAPPAMKVPAAPAVPRPEISGGAPKAGSFWPLITGLTVLLAIGALLVMYFVLKH